MLKFRLADDTLLRKEIFGVACYVHSRDDFFFIGADFANAVERLGSEWSVIAASDPDASNLILLSRLGVVEGIDGDGKHYPFVPHSGAHVLGDVPSLTRINNPLLVNCFATSWCPLKCLYCYADDLMTGSIRGREREVRIGEVTKLANHLDPMVCVVTGGDPLSRPKDATAMLEKLNTSCHTVIDTSGVGEPHHIAEMLAVRRSHVRISIDSIDQAINKKLRPVNKRMDLGFIQRGQTSLDYAARSLEISLKNGAGVSVQTVLTRFNSNLAHLLSLRSWLVSKGVRNWVIHSAVDAGSAFRVERKIDSLDRPLKSGGLLPKKSDIRSLRRLIDINNLSHDKIDIRVTNASRNANSSILIGSEGKIFSQGVGIHHGRKIEIDSERILSRRSEIWKYFSMSGHVSRYLNMDL